MQLKRCSLGVLPIAGCGGTLVAPDRVLTAAHCINGTPASELGAVAVGGQLRTPTHAALHPNWRRRNGSSNFVDDVAIVKLDQPVTGVPLVKLGGGVAAADALILGRGRPFAPGTGHSETESLDGSLRTAPLRSISDAACARAFKGYKPAAGERFDPRMRCSIDADGREPLFSGCDGDSGGPLWTGTPQAPVQPGIVSWGGDRCGADHLPSVFADIARYRAFITDPAPTWAPAGTGTGAQTVVISGTPRAGGRLTCATRGYRPETGAKLGYRWSIVGAGRGGIGRRRPLGLGTTYEIARSDRGYRVACFVEAGNDGGFVRVGVNNVLIRR